MEKNENLGLKDGEKILKTISPDRMAFLMWYILGIVLLFMLIGIFIIIFIELYRVRTKYYITNERVIYEYTFLANNVSSVRYSKIQDLHLNQGLIEKIFGIGNIEINTSGSGGMEIDIKGIKNSVKIKNIIEDHLSKKKVEKIEKHENPLDNLEKLHNLMKKGVITKSEFKQKKEEIIKKG